MLTLDQQNVRARCPECDVDYEVYRGSVYHEGTRSGLYLIALHGHDVEGRKMAHLAVAVRAPDGHAEAVALAVVGAESEMGFVFVDWEHSPWIHEHYLGQMLGREAALASPRQAWFLHVAEHVVRDLPGVEAYLESSL
ncbi:MAG: hypothetical protein R3F61_34015 [Myxococcota bacterium]